MGSSQTVQVLFAGGGEVEVRIGAAAGLPGASEPRAAAEPRRGRLLRRRPGTVLSLQVEVSSTRNAPREEMGPVPF